MTDTIITGGTQQSAETAVQKFKDELGPFVVAADTTRMPMIFTNALSPQNEIIYANKSFLDLMDYEKECAIGLPFHCIIADEANRANLTPKFISSIEKSTLDMRCRRKGGSEFDAAVLVSPVCDENGELQQYFISVVDLTDHIKSRFEAHAREAEFYEHAPGFIAFTDGPEHRFAFANAAYETLVGRRDLIGRRVADRLPELAGQGIMDALDKVYRTGRRLVGKHTPVQLLRRSDGELETRYIDFIYEPVRDASGEVVGLFCQGSDFTDAQAISTKLHDTQAQLIHVSRMNAMGTMAATLAHEINQPLAAIANYASGCAHILEESDIPPGKLHEGLTAIAAASDRAGKIISRLRVMTKRSVPIREDFDLSTAVEESVDLVRAGGCDNVAITTQSTPSLRVSGDKVQVQQVIVNLLRNACHAAAQSEREGTVVAITLKRKGHACVVVSDNGLGFSNGSEVDVFEWSESDKIDGMGIGLSISRTIAEAHGGSVVLDRTGATGTTFIFSLPPV